jgi:hypothetical protein
VLPAGASVEVGGEPPAAADAGAGAAAAVAGAAVAVRVGRWSHSGTPSDTLEEHY